jgi:hypothetical protein
VVQDVRRVGHSQAQPAVLRNDLDEGPQEVGQRDAEVAAVGARVLRRQPDLDDALLETLSRRLRLRLGRDTGLEAGRA